MIMSEKYSANKLQKVLNEKYLYLLNSEFAKSKYEILSFEVTEIVMNREEIDEISIDLKVDYLGPCEGESSDFCHMIQTVSSDVYNFFNDWHPDPKTFKMSKEYSARVSDPLFVKINYELDVLHSFYIYIILNYDTL